LTTDIVLPLLGGFVLLYLGGEALVAGAPAPDEQPRTY